MLNLQKTTTRRNMSTNLRRNTPAAVAYKLQKSRVIKRVQRPCFISLKIILLMFIYERENNCFKILIPVKVIFLKKDD